MSHRGEVSVKIDEPPHISMNKSDEKMRPPRLVTSGPSPRDDSRVSPRKSQSLTPRRSGADEHQREKSSTTPRKGATGPDAAPLKKEGKSKSGFLASFFGDAQPVSPASADTSPNPKGSKRRPGSTSMTADQLVSIREAPQETKDSFGRSSTSGISSSDPAKDSPRSKSIGFVASPPASTGSSTLKDPWKAKQLKSANAALAAELQLLQQYKLKEKLYAKQTNAATPFKYLELNPEDVEVLLKTPRSASSASSGGSVVAEPAEFTKLDPTSWAKWHIEMMERLKQRKAESAAQLLKSQRAKLYNLDNRKGPSTLTKKLPSSSSTGAPLIPSSASATQVHKEKRRESESDPSSSLPAGDSMPSPRSSGPGVDVDRRSLRGTSLKT